MKRHLLVLSLLMTASIAEATPGEQSPDLIWTELASGVLPAAQFTFDPPNAYTAFSLNSSQLQIVLNSAPFEFNSSSVKSCLPISPEARGLL